MLDDPISLFIPVGAIGRVVGKAGEKLRAGVQSGLRRAPGRQDAQGGRRGPPAAARAVPRPDAVRGQAHPGRGGRRARSCSRSYATTWTRYGSRRRARSERTSCRRTRTTTTRSPRTPRSRPRTRSSSRRRGGHPRLRRADRTETRARTARISWTATAKSTTTRSRRRSMDRSTQGVRRQGRAQGHPQRREDHPQPPGSQRRRPQALLDRARRRVGCATNSCSIPICDHQPDQAERLRLRRRRAARRRELCRLGGRPRVLQPAHLVGADFSNAYLKKTEFDNAVLRDAILRDAHAESASFFGADLRGADLRGADLGATSLLKTDLRDARLDGAYSDQRGDRRRASGRGLAARRRRARRRPHPLDPRRRATAWRAKRRGPG